MDMKQLQEERKQIFSDFWNNKTPKRLPVSLGTNIQVIVEYSKHNVFETQYNFARLAEASDEFCKIIYSDTCPVSGGGTPRFPLYNQILDSECYKMGSTGFVQHPEVMGMNDDEYPELIKDPYAFILEKVIPRLYKSLSLSDPVTLGKTLVMSIDARAKDNAEFASLSAPLIDKYGYYPGAPNGSTGGSIAPYDFIADFLRSFSGISMDIKRKRELLKEACDAVYPLLFLRGLVSKPHPEGVIGIPLHMPTFMREKDFVEVYLPSFFRMIREYAALGIRTRIFCEDDWTRYLDIIQDFPAGTFIRFEYGDPKTFAEKLGKKFFIGGFYPTTLLTLGTKQQCIDKTKELLDIMMPIKGYVFGFDKGPLILADVKLENLNAIGECLRDYGVFSDPGTPFGGILNSEGYTVDVAKSTHYESKYKFNWEDFRKKNPFAPDIAKKRYEELDLKMFNNYMSLVIG